MTVLMFGWEFPPHISGGLGTACFGLSRALLHRDVKLLFVIPRAHGDEYIPMINASDVIVDGEFLASQDSEMIPGTRVVAVESAIKPYSEGRESQALERWNWPCGEESVRSVPAADGVRYVFSGGYGPYLMEEVYRYAEVAAVLASSNEFDVIHAHDWPAYPAGIEAKKASGKPLVVHVHATEFDRAGENVNQHVFEIERIGMTQADRIIAVSQWTKDIIVDRYAIDPKKITVVHNGVEQLAPAAFDLIPKITDHVVTFLGRMTFQKGPEYFIDAAKKVLEYFPDVHFIMAGSGDLLPAMIDRVAQMKLSSRIHFTGFLKGDQIQQVWSVTDVFVMPSVSEPFGITPLEAAHAGVPVIVSNQSGVAEVIDHALKVDFWDTEALAGAIINVLRYKGLSESLSTNSKDEVATLTWARAATQIKQLYYEL